MKRPGTLLALWGFLVILFGGLNMNAVPPGGVEWPFFILLAAIPAGSVLGWKQGARWWQLASYLVITGAFFSAGVVFDGREDLRIVHGRDTAFALWSRFASVDVAIWVASGIAITLYRARRPRNGERVRTQSNPPVARTPPGESTDKPSRGN